MSLRGKFRQHKEQLANLWSYCKLYGKLYDFDYSSLLIVERNQIKRIRKHLANHKFFVGWETTVQKMDLAINLLDTLLEEKNSVIDLIDKDAPLFDNEGNFIEGKWRLLKYVNTKNARRFVSEHTAELAERGEEVFVADLYKEKAWKLYYRLREQYTRSWWD